MAENPAQPLLPQPEAEPVDKNDPAVQSAVNFVKDSRVRLTPVESKIRFLKQKGLSPSQIKYAFDQAGQNVPLEKIIQVKASPSGHSVSNPQGDVGASTAASTARTTESRLRTDASAQRVASLRTSSSTPTRTHTLYPPTPYEPEPVPQSTWDWRDVVIGTGAAAIAAVGGVKLFQRYSPYEFRRKDGKGTSTLSASARQQQAGRRQNNQQHRRYAPPVSSDTETDRGFGARPSGGLAASADSNAFNATSPLRPPPPPLPQAPAGSATAAASGALAAPDKDEEVKRLEKELADAKEALVGERKRTAELSLSVAKIRNEKQQLIHKNDKLSQKVDELEEQVKRLEEKDKKDDDKNEEDGEKEEEAQDLGAESPAGAADGVDQGAVEGGDGVGDDDEDVDNGDKKPSPNDTDNTVASETAAGPANPADEPEKEEAKLPPVPQPNEGAVEATVETVQPAAVPA